MLLLSSINTKNWQELDIQQWSQWRYSFCEGCPWSSGRPVQMERSNWGLEGVGKFCGNGETGESQQWRRRIPKSAASGQILQIGGNGEAPRRVAGENARSCPRLTLCPGQLLLLLQQTRVHVGGNSYLVEGKSENTGQSGWRRWTNSETNLYQPDSNGFVSISR